MLHNTQCPYVKALLLYSLILEEKDFRNAPDEKQCNLLRKPKAPTGGFLLLWYCNFDLRGKATK